MKKRVLSFLLSVVLFLSIIPITNVPAQAISIDSFNGLVSTFRSAVYPDKSTYRDDPGKTGGYQCFGFANEMALYIFGSYPTNSMSASTVNAGWTRVYGGSAIDNLSVGDIVRYNFHSIFITAIVGDTIYYAQANVPSGTNLVTYDNTISRSSLKSKVNNTLTHSGATTKGWVAHYNGGIPNTCSCSTNYAGEYTTKNVDSTLTIRSGHGTSYSVAGSIPANARFIVSKSDGSWAHITYNGISGYVSYSYIQKVQENQIDTRYPTPFKAYCISNDKIPAYDSVGGSTVGNIYGDTDFCEVLEVYTNGWVKVNCPWSGYSNGRIVYVKLSVFIDSNTSVTPKKVTAVNKTVAYYIAGGTSSPGSVYANDVCTIVAQKGSQYCVICPWSTNSFNGYYMVWCDSIAFVHSHSYGSWGNYDATYHSRYCSCGKEEKTAHTWNNGAITVYASCEGKGVRQYTCTVCGATKNESVAATGHSYNQGVITTPASCTTKGIKTYTCNTCGNTKSETIATVPHSYTAGVYTEPSHPHRIYNTCVCGAKKDIGSNGLVSSCTQCYPAPVISGIVSSKNEVYVGDTVKFTLNATGATEYCIDIGDGTNVLLEKKQTNNSVDFTFTKEGVHYIWGYAYNGEVYSASEVLTITVKQPKTLSAISIQSNPTKTVYQIGETLDTSGMKLKLTYSDNTTESITVGFTISGFSSATAGTKKVTVSYGGKTTSFNVMVEETVVTGAKYEITNVTGIAGSTVDVYVSIANNPGIISLRNTITYDSSALELISVQNCGLLAGYTTPSATITSPYTLRWADSLATVNNVKNGQLVKLTFQIKDGTEVGIYNISVSPVEARNVDGTKVAFSGASATVNVIDCIIGDTDGDGEVSDWDAIVLNRYLAGWSIGIELAAADVDGDDEVTDWDAIVLERYLAGWNVELES